MIALMAAGDPYHDGSRRLQDRFDTRRLADRLTERKLTDVGNGMYLSAGNVLVNPHVGLLFISFERRRRLRLEGTAEVRLDDPLAAEYTGAQFVVRVHAERVYPNCPRYIHRYALVERSRFVPRATEPPPIPDWKRSEWAYDALPTADPARAAGPLPGES
jgi:predicted pyridoxine 5'-phosphate oxidase superfamily flavin-nucleotide-binding protein